MAEQRTISSKTALWIIGGLIAFVLLIGIMASGNDGGPVSSPPVQTLPDATTTSAEPQAAGGRSELDPLNCARLLSNEEAVLRLEEDDPDNRLISSFLFSQGERCVHEDADDSRNYVILEPTAAADFSAGATRLDVEAERVDDVGGAAVWFGGTDAGSLSVAAESDFGTVIFRLEFGRHGIADDRRREHAVSLARLIVPRFPGIVLPSPPVTEPIEVDRPDEPFDTSAMGLLDSLLAGVDEGRWSEFEGHVATLEYLIGDTDGGEVLPDGGVADVGATDVLVRAHSYASTAPDDEAQVIEDLLDRFFPGAVLDPLLDLALTPADASADEADDDAADDEVALGATAAPKRLGRAALAQEDPTVECPDSDWMGLSCAEVYGPTGAGDDLDPGSYLVVGPASDALPVANIDMPFIDRVREGMTNAAVLFDDLGPMPNTIVFLTDLSGEAEVLADPRLLGGETCAIFVYDAALPLPEAELRQWIAFEMARCFLLGLQPDRVGLPGEPDQWVSPGALYAFSALAEPTGRLEAGFLTQFSGTELLLPVEQRARANVYLFLWLNKAIGTDGVVEIIAATPATGGHDDVADALASVSGFRELFHGFTRAVADRELIDGAGDQYDPQTFGSLTLQAQAGAFIDYDLDRLGADRAIVSVPSGQAACISFEPRGELAIGWRPFDSPGDWSTATPDQVEGEHLLVTTTAEEGAGYLLSVEKLVEAGESCDEDDEGGPSPVPDPIEVDECPTECGNSQYPHLDVALDDLTG